MHEAAPEAARFLADVTRGNIKKPDPKRIDAAKYIYDQVNGKAKQAIELQGEIVHRNELDGLSLADLLLFAEEIEKRRALLPAPIEAEYEEVEGPQPYQLKKRPTNE